MTSLVDANNLINIIPMDVEIEKLAYKLDEQRRLILTDGKDFRLDINEFSATS